MSILLTDFGNPEELHSSDVGKTRLIRAPHFRSYYLPTENIDEISAIFQGPWQDRGRSTYRSSTHSVRTEGHILGGSQWWRKD